MSGWVRNSLARAVSPGLQVVVGVSEPLRLVGDEGSAAVQGVAFGDTVVAASSRMLLAHHANDEIADLSGEHP